MADSTADRPCKSENLAKYGQSGKGTEPGKLIIDARGRHAVSSAFAGGAWPQSSLRQIRQGEPTTRPRQHRHRIRADSRFGITVGDELLDELADLVGPDNLLFTRR